MTTAASSPAIATPQQARSRRTLARILDAFEHALETQTFEEVTVGALCKRARCSVGTFYGRVESKDVLLDHLRERVFAEARTALAELFAREPEGGTTLSALVRRQLATLVDFHLARRGVLRAVIVQARRQTAFAGPTREFNTAVLRLVTHSWLAHREGIPHRDPVATVEQAALMVAGYLREAVVFSELWPTQRAVDRDALVDHLHHLVVSFLTTPPPSLPSPP